VAVRSNLEPHALALRALFDTPALRDSVDEQHAAAGYRTRSVVAHARHCGTAVADCDPEERAVPVDRNAGRRARVQYRVRDELGNQELGVGDLAIQTPGPQSVANETAGTSGSRVVGLELQRSHGL